MTTVLLVCDGCAHKPEITVAVERSPAADFGRYRTYDWRSPPRQAGSQQPPGEAMRQDWRLRAYVDQGLEAKGYARVTSGTPDFLVDYEFTEKEKHTSSFGDYLNYYQAGGSEGMVETFTFGYHEGTLVLGIFDGTTRQLVWRASATAPAEPQTAQTQLAVAVRMMLARLPAR